MEAINTLMRLISIVLITTLVSCTIPGRTIAKEDIEQKIFVENAIPFTVSGRESDTYNGVDVDITYYNIGNNQYDTIGIMIFENDTSAADYAKNTLPWDEKSIFILEQNRNLVLYINFENYPQEQVDAIVKSFNQL